MASDKECRAALERLAARLATADGDERSHHAFDRTMSAQVPDLGVTYSGALSDGHLTGITTEPAPRAQVRLTVGSDDLIALTTGELDFAKAWLSGRIRVEASVRDLLKLRSML
jgi:predicted lipid carrier protein YhbT